MELSIELSEDLAARLEARADASDFESVEEYVLFILEEVTTPRPEFEGSDPDAAARRSEVREQLESLGYLE